MEENFWIEKWRQKSIGFHRESFHPLLQRYSHQLPLGPKTRVLIPLCGKTKDLLWFEARSCQVLGIEIVNRAIREFFQENRKHGVPEVETLGNNEASLYRDGKLHLVAGDFFKLKGRCEKDSRLKIFSGGFDIIYDRASNVALPPEIRDSYYAHIRSHLKDGGTLFLISFEYEQGKMHGPPFSVEEREIRRAYADFDIDILHRETHILSEGKFYEAGLREMGEIVYLIQKKKGLS